MSRPDLLELVLQDPDDRVRRRVYADALLQDDDPRGRFIALQLDGSPEALDEASTLFRRHRKRWLGDLGRLLGAVELRAGFLHSAAGRGGTVPPQVVQRALASPELGTLVRLRRGRASQARLAALLTAPRARNLRDVEVPGALLPTLLDTRHLVGVEHLWLREVPPADVLERLAGHPSFAPLREVAFQFASGRRSPGADEVLGRIGEILSTLRRHGLEQVRSLWVYPDRSSLAVPPLEAALDRLDLDALTVGDETTYVRLQRREGGLLLRATHVEVGWVKMRLAGVDSIDRLVVELGPEGPFPGNVEKARATLASRYPGLVVHCRA